MKLNNKGFAISGILYSLLILFLSLFIGLLGILASTKFSYDKVKNDIINKLGNIPYKDDILNGADPVLKEGMIPVTITNDGKVYKANLKNRWYDYDAKMWANAVTVTAANRQTYMDAAAGTMIEESDILTYFVWIPRYRYKLWYTDTSSTTSVGPHSIDIVFENKNTIKSIGSSNGEYLTHPAFKFGEEVNGIWVGKFETGYNGAVDIEDAKQSKIDSSKVIIKPSTTTENVYSWRYNSVSNIYYTVQGMTTINTFGLSTDSDTHMMKNTEWGAVAYLSHSEYGTCTNGICKEVYINNSTFMTGCGGDSVSEVNVNTCKNQYGTKTDGIYNQSTTGNISGIFDMSGGSHEYVMGYTTESSPEYGSSGFNATTFPKDPKYIDLYSVASNNYSDVILGDATGEMGPFYDDKGWYSDSAKMIDSNYSWYARGGGFHNESVAGIFNFYSGIGSRATNASFRVVLV